MEHSIKNQAKSDIFKELYPIIKFYIKKGACPKGLKKYYKKVKNFNGLLEDLKNKGINLIKDEEEYKKLVREILDEMLDDFIASEKDKKGKLKYIKEFNFYDYETNELFGSKKEKGGDKFATNLIDIIEKENIPIKWGFVVVVDGEEYSFDCDEGYGLLMDDYYFEYNETRFYISRKVYKRLENLYWKQQKENKQQQLKNLPDISDIGRTSKKYNL